MRHSENVPSTRIGLVVTDLAGTTVDFGCQAPSQAFEILFRNHGIEVTEQQIREPMGQHKRDHIRAICRMPDVARQWRQNNGRDVSAEDVSALFDEFVPTQLECIKGHGDLIPGTAEVTANLQKRGVKIGATTGYNREMLDVVLERARKQGFVPDVAYCSVDVPAGRPAPWMLFRCMEETGVYPACRVVKIGDTVSDMQAGRHAGAWCVGVAETGNLMAASEADLAALDPDERERRLAAAAAALRSAGAHVVIGGFAELPAAIREIEASGKRP